LSELLCNGQKYLLICSPWGPSGRFYVQELAFDLLPSKLARTDQLHLCWGRFAPILIFLRFSVFVLSPTDGQTARDRELSKRRSAYDGPIKIGGICVHAWLSLSSS